MNWCNDNRITINKLVVLLSGAMSVFFLIAATYFQFKDYQSGVDGFYTDLWLSALLYAGIAIWHVRTKENKEKAKKRFS